MEIKSMLNNVFKVTVLPADRRAIKVRWIYRIKRDKNGDVKMYKAGMRVGRELGYQHTILLELEACMVDIRII